MSKWFRAGGVRAAGVLAAALLAPEARAQAPFEGVITYAMTGNKGQALEMRYMTKGSRYRMEMGPESAMIMDAGSSSMILLMPAQKSYMRMDLRQAAAGMGSLAEIMEKAKGGGRPAATGARAVPATPPKITATGRTETIAGHSCEHYLFGDAQDMDVCAAKGLGYFGMGAGSARGPMGMGAGVGGMLPPGWDHTAKAFADGFLPLKLERVKAGTRELVMECTQLERKALADALFVPPPDYKEIKMPGFGRP
jgi:hypothetical protein